MPDKARKRPMLWVLGLLGLQSMTQCVWAQTPSDDRLKVAFLYNFVLFADWPAEVGRTLHLCLQGQDSLGTEIDALQGKTVGGRKIMAQRKDTGDSLKDCQIVFISTQAMGGLPRVLDELRERPVLTVADSPGAARQGVILNMSVTQNKVLFEVNLKAARAARLGLSSKLLRLAMEVYQ